MQRKKIIISEIKYWKKSKLLPEQYCDFLLALYSHGEEEVNKEEKFPASVLAKEKKKINRRILFLVLLSAISSASLFIVSNYPVIAVTIAAIFVIVLLSYAIRHDSTQSAIYSFLYIASAFMLLAMSLKIWLVFFEGHTMLLIGLLLINCLLWLFTGRLLNLLYFTISGGAGILLIVGFLLTQF